ncbi:MAG: TolC family outer membrane protein [Hyphomonadaceae bacterium]|nr:TolC family outer membrane protein [Hyphomonadaceae bacterium]
MSVAIIAFAAPSLAGAETLPDALAAAYRNNPTLEAARLSAASADENTAQARAAYLPSVDVTASTGVRESSTETAGAGTTTQNTEPRTASVIAQQALYTGGFRGAQSAAARASVARSRENLRAVEQDVMLAAISAYVDVLRDQEFVRIRTADVTLLERQLEEARARFDVGDVTLTDVSQAEARLAGSRSGLSQAQSALEGSRARYVQIVGEAPGELVLPPPPPALPASLDEAVERALDSNPDIRDARANERLASAQVGIERSALLPQLTAVARWDESEDSNGPDVRGDSASAVAQLTIPLFEGGFARSRVRQSRIEEQRAASLTEQAERAVVSQLTAAWNDYLAAERVVFSSQEQVRANELAFEGVQEERSVGLRTSLDVLNAQQELLNAQLAVASAQRDAYVATHAVLQAIGLLDAGALGVNVPLYDPDQHARAVGHTILSTQPALDIRGRE